MNITPKEHALLMLLQNNPTITYAEIARHFDVSPPTAKKMVEKLRARGLYAGKYAQYNPRALKLERYIVVATVPRVENYAKLEKVMDRHPYTRYRARIYGSQLGLQATFDFPADNPQYLEELYEELVKQEVIEKFEIYRSTGIGKYLPLDLTRVSIHSMNWEYDWKDFMKIDDQLKAQLSYETNHNYVIDKMKELDLKILRLLSYDADISQREMARKYNVDPTEIWRRVHFLEDNVITSYRAKINRTFFNVTSSKLIFMQFEEKEMLNKTFLLLSDEKRRPPFRYTLEILEDRNKNKNLMIFISLPQHHEAHLCYALYQLGKIKMYNLDTTGRSSVTYAFYEKNYDFNARTWKASRDYVITEPLQFEDEN